ncbi:MAG: hypothetical protein AAF601_01735 [Pseudomonadota bacterium]
MTNDYTQAARETFSGKTMTDTQIKKAMGIAVVIEAEIQRSGSFKGDLTDYAHAFARNEKFDALRGETMIRDTFTARYGMSMNQMREGLLEAEQNLPETARTRALACAETIGDLIQKAPTQPFYQAYDRAGTTLSKELGITQNAAKSLMSEMFAQQHGKELYAHGKEVEEAYHTPVREAEIAARKAEKLQSQTHSQSYG